MHLLLGRLIRLLNVFPKAAARESVQASDDYITRRHHIHRPKDNYRFCLSRRNRCYRIGLTGECACLPLPGQHLK